MFFFLSWHCGFNPCNPAIVEDICRNLRIVCCMMLMELSYQWFLGVFSLSNRLTNCLQVDLSTN